MRSGLYNSFALVWIGLGSLCFSSHSYAAVPGTYVLDKATLGKTLDARFAKLPPDRKAFVGMAKVMFGSLEMRLTLNQDGKAQTLSSMKVMGRAQTYLGEGKWEQKGNTVTISTQVTAKQRPAFPQTMVCEVTPTGMSCYNPKMKKHPLPFVRHNTTATLAPVQRGATSGTSVSPTPARVPSAPKPANAR